MSMLTLAAAPTDPVVTLAEARAHLRMYDETDTSEDVYIQSLIDTVRASIDGPAGFLGRALTEQEIVLTLDQFPCWTHGRYYAKPIKIPMPPLVSVDSVKYTATDGTETTYTGFRVFGVGAEQGGYIMPQLNGAWPSTAIDPGAVRIEFTAGYDAGAAAGDPNAVPANVKHAMKLLISHFFEHREENLDTGAKFGLLELPFGIWRLLDGLKFRG